MGRIAFLTDRSPDLALPAILSLGLDIKVEPLAVDSVAHLAEIAPTAVIADAEENPEHAHRLLEAIVAERSGVPVLVLLSRSDLERFRWQDVAEEFVHSGCSVAELRLRLAMLTRRTGGGGDATIRLGPLSINTETYHVGVAGQVMDLTYKEFELLRFLVQRPSRVFTRSELLQQVWGYNFYGGTRTVDVHIRRLRAKLGSEHEGLIQTVRGVGYRVAEPGASSEP